MGLIASFKFLILIATGFIAWSAFKGYSWIHELPAIKKLGEKTHTQIVRWGIFAGAIFFIWFFVRRIL